MYNTKSKILDASIRLFNENGIDSVRLQQIAEEVGISVGNLAYHFKGKELLIEAVYERVFEDFDTIFQQYLRQPDLMDFDSQINAYYHFFHQNKFYLSEFFKANNQDTPHYRQWQRLMSKMMIQLRSRLQFMVMRGELQPETQPGQYEILVEQVWLTLVFFIPRCNMTGLNDSVSSYRKNAWNIIRPYLTEAGLREFSTLILPQISF